MKIGILFTSHPDAESDPYPHRTVHDRVTREIMEAEEDGFDAAWIAEHHFSNTYGILPDPFAYLAYLAAKTSRIKLCAGVMVVPLHHPMRIVENAAFIDILSGGRFQLGLGSGYRPYEFEGLGIDYERRREIQQEAIPLILKGFHEKRMVHAGKYFNINIPEPQEIFPQPVQQPHPPIYLGAGTDGSIIQAARNGFGLMQSSLPNTEVLARHIELYHSHMHEAPPLLAKNPAFGQTDVVRMVYVAETDAKAREESEAGITRHMRSFLVGTGKYLGDVTEKSNEDDFTYEKVVNNTILHGSPDTVLRQLEQLAKVGITSVMIHYPPYYGLEKTLKMLRFFGKEVLPHAAKIEARKPQAAAARAVA